MPVCCPPSTNPPISRWFVGFLGLFVFLFPLPTVAQVATGPLPEAKPSSQSPKPAGNEPLIAGFARFHADHPTDARRAGILLAAELSCTACHHSDNPLLAPKRGPSLEGINSRLRLDWVRRFLRDPQKAKPGTTMPDLFADETPESREAKIASLLHFLASLPERPEHFQLDLAATDIVHPEFWERGDSDRGEVLYHRIGCLACHAPDPEFETSAFQVPEQQQQMRELGLDDEEIAELLEDNLPDDAPVVPLPRLAEKYSARSLAYFLLKPLATRPAGRMPDLHLTPAEAADLTAYLRNRQPASPDAVAAERDPSTTGPHPSAVGSLDAHRVAEGRRLFESVGCSQCHPLPGAAPVPLAVAPWQQLRRPAKGLCQTTSPSLHAPNFPLSPAQQAAIAQLLDTSADDSAEQDEAGRGTPPDPQEVDESKAHGQPEFQREAAERLTLALEQLNCLACHRRDERGGVGADRWRYFETVDQIDLGDEGRIPPSLDQAGWKLTDSWLTKVLLDGDQVRPHMPARMPRFGETQVRPIAELLSAVDQPTRPAWPEVTGDLEAGRKLLDVGCIQCHPLRGERLPGVMGVDLADAGNRLQRDWFFEFVRDPAEWKPGTRMPTFFPNGVSNSPEIADGDVPRQLASLWAYLNSDADNPLPDRLATERLHNFELVPDGEPIVLRTFMKEAGMHAVAVGYPRQVSLAFDTWWTRPAIAWKGPFLDAHPIWYDRFSPPTPPLGEPVVHFPPGPLVALLTSADSPWPEFQIPPNPSDWKGYSLDEGRIPTFQYTWRGRSVEDRFEPLPDGAGLTRRIVVHPSHRRSSEEEKGREKEDGKEPSDTRESGELWCRLHAGTMLKQVGSEVVDQQGLRVRLVAPATSERRLRLRPVAGEDREVEHGEHLNPAVNPSHEWILQLAAPPSTDDVTSEEAPNRSAAPIVLEIEYRW